MLKLKKGTQVGQPDHQEKELSVNQANILKKPTTKPIIITSISHAMNLSPQSAVFSPVGCTLVGANGVSGEADTVVAGVPHLEQNCASGESSKPQFLQ